MIHLLDKEDKGWNKKTITRLNKWVKDFKKTAPTPHPFQIVGAGKPNRGFDDRVSRKD
jgi:hypothetical protein